MGAPDWLNGRGRGPGRTRTLPCGESLEVTGGASAGRAGCGAGVCKRARAVCRAHPATAWLQGLCVGRGGLADHPCRSLQQAVAFAGIQPGAALPVQHLQGAFLPVHHVAVGAQGVRVALFAQAGDHLAADPAADAAVLRVVVEDQQRVDAAVADQQFALVFAPAVAHPGRLQLVRVQVAGRTFVERYAVDQPRQVVEDEPGLVVQQQRTELAAVAGEQGGDEDLVVELG